MAAVEYKISGVSNNIRLEMQTLIFPNRCPCCGTPNPTSSYKESTGIITGYRRSVSVQTTDYIWKEWDIPYCSFCLEHDKEESKYTDAVVIFFWAILIWVIVSLIVVTGIQASILSKLAIVILGLAFIMAIWGRKVIKKTKRKPTCFVPNLVSSPRCFSVDGGKFSSKSPLHFLFSDPTYERDFIEINRLYSNS